jgi:hypothetical protein
MGNRQPSKGKRMMLVTMGLLYAWAAAGLIGILSGELVTGVFILWIVLGPVIIHAAAGIRNGRFCSARTASSGRVPPQ